MKKTTKGAIAAGGAAVLLLGGAGSLAYWTDSNTINGGSFTTGTLGLKLVSCDSGWTYANGSAAGSNVNLIVPGDQIQKSCTYTINATGDHISAALTTPSSVNLTPGAGSTSYNATVGASYTLNGAAASNPEITATNNGQTLVAKLTVTFPFGNSGSINVNDTQNVTQTLNGLTVTLSQDQSTGKNPNA